MTKRSPLQLSRRSQIPGPLHLKTGSTSLNATKVATRKAAGEFGAFRQAIALAGSSPIPSSFPFIAAMAPVALDFNLTVHAEPGAVKSLTSMCDRLVLDTSERDDRHGALLDADMTADALILMERQLKHGESGAPRSWTST